MKFAPDEMIQEGRWLVSMDNPTWIRDNELKYRGSLHVVGSRLLGLSYPDYLQYLHSCGGTLKGKEGYTYAYFTDKSKCQAVCNELNRRWEFLWGEE